MTGLIGPRLLLASHNPGKLIEIKELVEPFGVSVVTAPELRLPVPDETETSFAGNARLKALAAAQAAGLPALSDDSGIEVHALGGAPGVHTADWAETPRGRNFAQAMARLHRELLASGAAEPWRATFVAALCLGFPDGSARIYEGRITGRVIWPPRGARGFGFDPVFLPEGESETFGEMDPERKHAISHRRRAFDLFVADALA